MPSGNDAKICSMATSRLDVQGLTDVVCISTAHLCPLGPSRRPCDRWPAAATCRSAPAAGVSL